MSVKESKDNQGLYLASFPYIYTNNAKLDRTSINVIYICLVQSNNHMTNLQFILIVLDNNRVYGGCFLCAIVEKNTLRWTNWLDKQGYEVQRPAVMIHHAMIILIFSYIW